MQNLKLLAEILNLVKFLNFKGLMGFRNVILNSYLCIRVHNNPSGKLGRDHHTISLGSCGLTTRSTEIKLFKETSTTSLGNYRTVTTMTNIGSPNY